MQPTSKHNSYQPGQYPEPWLAHYPSCVPAKLDYPEFPTWGLLDQSAKQYPTRTACKYYKQSLTYSQLAEAARRTASALVRMGVVSGDRVGIMLPNTPEYITAINGIWMAGGVAVAMSPLMVAREVADLMTSTNCRVVICLDILAPLVIRGDYQPKHILFTTLRDRLPHWQRLAYAFARVRRLGFWPPADAPNQHCYEDEIAKSPPDFQPVRIVSNNEPALVLPTGGTTGEPKAVVLSHKNLVANAWQLSHWAGMDIAKHTILAVVPFFHSYGLSTCVTTGAALAATLVLHHRFVPRTVIRLIEKHQPTVFQAVPAMLTALNDLLRRKPVHFSQLRFCISGGAPLDPQIADEFAEQSGAIVVEGYGLSEASPVTHTGPLDGTNRPGTIGIPLPDTQARIVDTQTGRYTLPLGEVGELLVRGPQVMLGYWENPEATQQVIRDGWLHTGDLAVCDANGFFRIVDRKKDLIITSGFNVYPNEVEQILRQISGVADAAVIGIPDPQRGELVKALLVLEPDVCFNRKFFDHFVEQHLAKHKRPHIVEIIEADLPRSFLGKVIRRELREQENLQCVPEHETLCDVEPTS